MTLTENLKQKLHLAIERLPEDRLQPVLELVNQLLAGEKIKPPPQPPDREPAPADDPLLRYIGGVAHGALAQNIDEDGYLFDPDRRCSFCPRWLWISNRSLIISEREEPAQN